ncbi:hypothetical protein ACI8B_180066 [Acinetobacter proteolyticus]|uniref:Uncharacterized protein n=1 Tax=Acinetobacter proteolyticus TaxID=1776741 RepID=A0A653K1H5_9GAMM|nr:hypothetical protein ACI8B_180066 [Acinetobacter proteolyticus]
MSSRFKQFFLEFIACLNKAQVDCFARVLFKHYLLFVRLFSIIKS